jgi:hypothetical protein
MTSSSAGKKATKATLGASLDRLCRNPVQVRVALAAVLAAGWYTTVYRPLSDRIAAAREDLETQKRRLVLADAVEILRTETERFNEHLPPRADPNEAVQYLLDGVKSLPVRLVSIAPMPGKELGPFKTVTMRLRAEGTYPDLDGLLRWVETDRRLLRVDEIKIGPSESDRRGTSAAAKKAASKQAPRYEMDLVIVGVIG